MKLKHLRLLFVVLVSAIFFAGCSMYRGQSFWEASKTKVDLEANNFKVRKLGAQGNGSCAYLFGLALGGPNVFGIPLGNQNVQEMALKRLHENWDGQGSCFFHNINTEWTNYGVPAIFLWHQYTITADIYEFDKEYVDYARRSN